MCHVMYICIYSFFSFFLSCALDGKRTGAAVSSASSSYLFNFFSCSSHLSLILPLIISLSFILSSAFQYTVLVDSYFLLCLSGSIKDKMRSITKCKEIQRFSNASLSKGDIYVEKCSKNNLTSNPLVKLDVRESF